MYASSLAIGVFWNSIYLYALEEGKNFELREKVTQIKENYVSNKSFLYLTLNYTVLRVGTEKEKKKYYCRILLCRKAISIYFTSANGPTVKGPVTVEERK